MDSVSFVQPCGLCEMKHFKASCMDNYSALLELWETILNDKPDSETRARVNGIDSQMKMKTFNFYFGASHLLSHIDNLSKTLKQMRLNAAEGQNLVRMTTTTLKSIRIGEKYKLFWQKTIMQANKLDTEEPRKRKALRRYEVGDGTGVTPEEVGSD